MLRYVVLAWNSMDECASGAARQLSSGLERSTVPWHCVFAEAGARVYCVIESPHSSRAEILHGSAGVVMGTLFERQQSGDSNARTARGSFGASASSRVLASRGQELVRRYWGNYVAVIYDPIEKWISVLRGPASSLPCMRATYERVHVCFSSFDDYECLTSTRVDIDWEYVASHVITTLCTSRTAVRGVVQINPGERLDIERGRSKTTVLWDPYGCAGWDGFEDIEVAQRELKAAVLQCVQAWRSCHETVLLNLSGGLDSSIVLASLRQADEPARVVCLTEYSPGSDSDERTYARAVVRMLGCEVHKEQLRNPNVRLEEALRSRRTAVPTSYLRTVETLGVQTKLAGEFGATAVFSGGGGDALFYQNAVRLSAADFVERRGFRPSFARIAYRAAQLEGLSVWRILRESVSRPTDGRQDPYAEVRKGARLVRAEMVENISSVDAGCQSLTGNAPPGKRLQILGISRLYDYYNPMSMPGGVQQIAPLMSQPLMETVLRIPTYVLLADGWERGLARRAFSKDLPPEIVRRRTKGGIEEHMQALLRYNVRFIRDLLADGLLVKRGFLDRSKVLEALSLRPSGTLTGMAEMCRHIDTEIWLRILSARSPAPLPGTPDQTAGQPSMALR